RESQARRVRPVGRPRRSSRRALRSGRRTHRGLRALLVVHGGHGYVPSASRRAAGDRRGGGGGARARGAPRDRLPQRAARRRRRGASPCAPVRRAGLRHLSARVKVTLFTDGGARGNPGPAAFAYVLEDETGAVLASHGETIGVATNNVAEYRGLVAGLATAVELGDNEADVGLGAEHP